MQKFLIIQTAFIGDVVLATAVAEKLHLYYPEAQIDFFVRKGNELLFDGHPFIKKVWVWNKRENKLFNLFKLIRQVRKENYDEVINLQRFFSSGLLTVFSGAKYTSGFTINPLSVFFTQRKTHHISRNGVLHEVARNQQLIQHLTDVDYAKPRLYPSFADQQNIKHLIGQPYICCAPGSVWFTKQYPKSHWIAFLKQLPTDLVIYFIGAKTDRNLIDELIEVTENSQAQNLSGELSFLESAALMKGAVMNFANDSAPMHFATALNAPITAIFCSTVPAFGYGPLSNTSIILETPENLKCRPCGIHGLKKCPLGHFKCAYTILPERLVRIVYERRNK